MFHFLRGQVPFSRSAPSVSPDPVEVGTQKDRSGTSASNRTEFRRMLVQDIGTFLIANNLELSAINFEFARDIVSGHDVRLQAAMQDLIKSGGQLTDAVVKELVARTTPDRLSPETLVGVLYEVEAQADALLGLTARTRLDVHDYGSALRTEASAMADDSGSGVLARLVTLTLGMVERTQAIEAEMHESHKQAKKLKRNLDKARHAADHDALTGLPNRRAFERRLAEAITAARETSEPLSLAFCDIDHFKTINDGHGHATGDRVLCLVADLLIRISGSRCHVSRHGGEEFILLFPNHTADEALIVVEAARSRLAGRKLVNRDNSVALPPVTFSSGIADVMAFATSSDALAAADAALYAAKQSGRNRVLIYGAGADAAA